MTETTYKNFGFTVTKEHDKDNMVEFKYKNGFRSAIYVSGFMSTDHEAAIRIESEDLDIMIRMSFMADFHIGKTRKVSFKANNDIDEEYTVYVELVGVEEDKQLPTCIQRGGYKFKITID